LHFGDTDALATPGSPNEEAKVENVTDAENVKTHTEMRSKRQGGHADGGPDVVGMGEDKSDGNSETKPGIVKNVKNVKSAKAGKRSAKKGKNVHVNNNQKGITSFFSKKNAEKKSFILIEDEEDKSNTSKVEKSGSPSEGGQTPEKTKKQARDCEKVDEEKKPKGVDSEDAKACEKVDEEKKPKAVDNENAKASEKVDEEKQPMGVDNENTQACGKVDEENNQEQMVADTLVGTEESSKNMETNDSINKSVAPNQVNTQEPCKPTDERDVGLPVIVLDGDSKSHPVQQKPSDDERHFSPEELTLLARIIDSGDGKSKSDIIEEIRKHIQFNNDLDETLWKQVLVMGKLEKKKNELTKTWRLKKTFIKYCGKKDKVKTAQDDPRIGTYTEKLNEWLEEARCLVAEQVDMVYEQQEEKIDDVDGELATKKIAHLVQGCRGTLNEEAYKVSSLLGFPQEKVSLRIATLAERKSWGVPPTGVLVNQDTSENALWVWEVVNTSVFDPKLQKVLGTRKRKLQAVSRRIKDVKHLLNALAHNFDSTSEKRALKREETVQKHIRNDESRHQKEAEIRRKEQERNEEKEKREKMKEQKEKERLEKLQLREAQKLKEKEEKEKAKNDIKQKKQEEKTRKLGQPLTNFFKRVAPSSTMVSSAKKAKLTSSSTTQVDDQVQIPAPMVLGFHVGTPSRVGGG